MRRLRFWRSIVHPSSDGVSISEEVIEAIERRFGQTDFRVYGRWPGQVRARLLGGPSVSGSNSSSPARRTESIARVKLQASTDNVSRVSRRSK